MENISIEKIEVLLRKCLDEASDLHRETHNIDDCNPNHLDTLHYLKEWNFPFYDWILERELVNSKFQHAMGMADALDILLGKEDAFE